MIKLNLNTEKSELLNNKSSEKIELDEKLTQLQIIELIKKHSNQKYYNSLLEIIIYQYNEITDNILNYILDNSNYIPLANDIVTCGKASDVILNRLLVHPSDSVSKHAELALLSNRLKTMSSEELEIFYLKLLEKKYELMDEANTYFAYNPKTPKKILSIILKNSGGVFADYLKRIIGQNSTL